MISDSLTNTIYLSDALRMDDAAEYKRFRIFLESHGLSVKLLDWTNDIYCRDYMPVQVDENDFVQFVFKPDSYYKRSELELITNPVQVHIANKLQHIRYSNIILDGGNMVKWKDKVIITNKVYVDNRYQFESDEAILEQLEEELRCEVIIIPADKEDETGHADGMVRFIDDKRVFINDPDDIPDKEWLNKFLNVLHKNSLTPVPVPCAMKDGQKTGDGLSINYLQVGNLIVVPKFNLKEDLDAFDKIREEFGEDFNVIQYDARAISKYGGVLNCATWAISNAV